MWNKTPTMKKINTSLLLIFSFISFYSYPQNGTDLVDLTVGTAHGITGLWDAYPKYPIHVMNVDDKTEFTKDGIVMSDAKKSYGTVLGVLASPNKYYIASFAPLPKGVSFSGQGEFYLYENNNGSVTQLEHFIGNIRASTGEANIEYFDNANKTIVVSIKNKFEVQFFMFKGYMWGLPKDYYDYNPQGQAPSKVSPSQTVIKQDITPPLKKYDDNCKYPSPIPTEIIETIKICNQLYLNGKLSECATKYDVLIAKYPDYCVGYYNQGLAKYYKGDKIGAKDDFQKAVSLGFLETKDLLAKYYGE